MKKLKQLKKLARDLTIQEIAEIVLLKAHQDNINSEMKEVDESLDNFSYDLKSLNETFKSKKRGYIVHRAFHYDNVMKNIDSLVELAYNRDIKLKRKYLKMDYHVIKFLVNTDFIKIIESDENSSNQDDIIIATDKLVTFLEDRQVEYNRWNYNEVNADLIKEIINILFEQNGSPIITD